MESMRVNPYQIMAARASAIFARQAALFELGMLNAQQSQRQHALFGSSCLPTTEQQREEKSTSAAQRGLELLRAACLEVPTTTPRTMTTTESAAATEATSMTQPEQAPGQAKRRRSSVSTPPFAKTIQRSELAVASSPFCHRPLASTTIDRIYIDQVGDWDVLCGRGGRSNHHSGNKRYREVVSEMKMAYRNMEGKSEKTDLSQAVVERVYRYGGRFVKQDQSTGKYYLLTPAEARKKTSQALRETKKLKLML